MFKSQGSMEEQDSQAWCGKFTFHHALFWIFDFLMYALIGLVKFKRK
jgi:hypothetical protein